MTAMFQTGSGIAGPPPKMRQNETVYWQDVPFNDRFNNEYDSGTYTLTYIFAGPIATPLQVTATPGSVGASGEGWITTLTAAQAASLVPGIYGWQAVLTAAGPPSVRIVAAEGEVVVEADLAIAGANFDPRSTWQIILSQCETALQAWAASGQKIRSYRINGREMMFEGVNGIVLLEKRARSRVEAEKQIASGGDRRNIRIGFSPPSSGVPTDSSKNWPWW